MHLPIANNLASRDGTTAKDEGGRNVVIETDGEASVCLKRPGALSLGAVGTGVGQLLACYNNQLKSIVGNTLADLIVTILAPGPGTPSAPGATVQSSQPITSIDPDLPFFSQVAGQAQSQNVIVFKNAKEAWVYKP